MKTSGIVRSQSSAKRETKKGKGEGSEGEERFVSSTQRSENVKAIANLI